MTAIEEMLMMAPLFCARMIGITCLAAKMQLLRLIATQRSSASSVISSSSASPPARLTPTLLCRMSMRPQRACASATMASMSASRVTSASKATAVPPLAPIMSTVSWGDVRLWSTHSTLAPSRAKVSAVARPLPMPSPGLWPAPTTMAMRSFRRMSFHSRDWVLHQYLFVSGLVVYFHGGQHADHGAVEGDGEHEVGHMLVRELLLDLGERSLGHRELAHHLACAPQDCARQRLERRRPALGLRHHVADILVGDAVLLADLHVMGEFVFRLLHPAHLKNRKFTQARVKLALEADVAADAAEGARHVGRIDQELVQVGVALEHVAIFGSDPVGLEIGQAGHLVGSPLTSTRFRHCEPTGRRRRRPMTGSAKQFQNGKHIWTTSSLRSPQ